MSFSAACKGHPLKKMSFPQPVKAIPFKKMSFSAACKGRTLQKDEFFRSLWSP
jgi:hypothetical protein